MTKTQTALVGGNLVTSGGSVILLVTALQVLGQHGDELNEMRGELRDLRTEVTHTSAEMDLRMIKVETQTRSMVGDVDSLKRLMHDPHARPGAWTRSDDDKRMDQYDEAIRTWVRKKLLEERTRVFGSGPIGMRDLVDIQKAIAQIHTDDEKAWTHDGKPKVDRIEQILMRQVSEADRDRAWSMLQTARTLR